MRNIKGITLIALIITIIILLILAGITITQLTGSGLFGKAGLAKQKTRYVSAKEIIDLRLMEIQVDCEEKEEEYTINKIAEGMKETKDITIEKYYNTETSKIKNEIEENLINLEGIVVSVDKYSEYKFLIGEKREIAGVLEGEVTDTTSKEDFINLEEFEEKAFSSNDTTATDNVEYLYNKGNQYEEITGGWCKASDINASADIDNYNYFDLDSKTMDGNMAIISTNKSIDITNYTKLKVEASAAKNGDIIASKNWGYTIGLNNPKQIGLKVPTDPHKYSAGLKQEEGEEIILEKDITDIDGEYFIGISTTAFHIKIHKVWLE